jgi:hypothetical protein
VAKTLLREATVDDWGAVIAHGERRRLRQGDVVVRFG